MNTFKIKVMASNKMFYEGDAISVTVPSVDGQIEIMAGYEPYIIPVDPGEVILKTAQEEELSGACGRGFVRVSASGEVEVIVDTLEKPEEIDIRRAQEAMERAQEQLRQRQSIEQFYIQRAAMARAMSRLKEASRVKH